MDKKTLFDILVRLGPVFSGLKPAELINIKKDETLNKLKKSLVDSLIVNYIDIRDFEKQARRQIFFYNINTLTIILQKQSVVNFLSYLGYPLGQSLEENLSYLTQRLQSDNFPHEVGIFLGYPLKDVLGYMGVVPLPVSETKGWRYFGDVRKSREQYNSFQKSREVTRYFLMNIKELFE